LTTADVDLDALRELLRARVLLLCHHNADPDSICAAYAFKELVAALDPEVEADIVLTDGASLLSRKIMEKLGIAVGEVSPSDHVDALVALDTATLSQLADWGEAVASSEAPRVFIDHHSPHPEIRSIASMFIVDEAASSTCEIVHGLFEGYGLSPSRSVANALLAGMAFDSRHFTIGTARTFRSVSRLLEIGSPLEEIVALLAPERNRSESIARLKAAQRMQLHAIGGWTIATSHVSSYQASAARALLRLGADAVVVAGVDKGELRASIRATEEFYNETRIHLGRDVAQPLGEEYGGAGSGHSTAAGVNGVGRSRAMLLRAVELISEKLNK
jgi:phosphoesterase RecJ-like protein